MNPDLQVTQEGLDYVKNMILDSPNELIRVAGVQVEDIGERRIKVALPLTKANVNHVGTAYAISMVLVMECAGASLLQCTYGLKKYVPIIQKMEIRYLKPSKDTLICDLSMTEAEAEERIAPIEERGRGRYPLHIPLSNVKGEEIAEADIDFYLIPADMKL